MDAAELPLELPLSDAAPLELLAVSPKSLSSLMAQATHILEEGRAARMTYEERRDLEGRKQLVLSAKGREIGVMPDIADIPRRERCRASLRLFCETYLAEAFSLAWCADQLTVIARIEESIFHGALFAMAMPRGSGKSTIARAAALWGISYGHCRYLFLIGANAPKATDSINSLKTSIRFSTAYKADFPEIAYPANKLAGIAQRARGQLCQGRQTLIEWDVDRVILPTVPPPANWPVHWQLRSDGMVPTSSAVISTSGLTGDSIRGSLITLPTGENLRPDFVLLDDPQTPESARSPSQNATREQLIGADVLGMSGPGKKISAIACLTVIARGDMADSILDRKKHPMWRGERTRMLRTMPTDMPAWDKYFEFFKRCAQKEPPDFAEANAYYEANQPTLDAGAEASWPERKLPREVSAIQHAMHLFCRDRRAFFSEYQNDPLPDVDPLPGELTADQIAARVNRHARGVAPSRSTRLTAFVDVQQDLLWYAVCAWEDTFTGSILEASAWPDQRRPYFALREANPTIQAATKIGSLEGSLWAALDRLCKDIIGRDWLTDTGGKLRVERCMVDSGWGMSTETVKRFCRQSEFAAVLLPSKGIGIGAAGAPMESWPKKPGERRGGNWIIPAPKPGEGRMVLFDANFYKSFLHARLGTPLGEAGALTLWGDDPQAHRMLADHLTAEYRVRTEGRGRSVDEWRPRPNHPDNHLLDCVSGCTVAAAMQGAALPGMAEAKPERKRVSFAEAQEAARKQREAFEQRRGR
jgi:hypothetical protein